MDVLKLLQSKNKCLRKFLELSEEFLLEASNDSKYALNESLPAFQDKREACLKGVDLYDRKISEALEAMPRVEKTPSLVNAVQAALKERDQVVQEILEIDLRIIGVIEKAKTALIQELSTTRKSQQILNKFKSGWVSESGEELDKEL